MKICIVSQIFAPQEEGGAEISARHTAKNLGLRHEIVVLALGMEGQVDAEPGEAYSAESFRIFRMPFKNTYLPAVKDSGASKLSKAIWHTRSAIGAIDEIDLEKFFAAESFDLIYAQNSSRMQPVLFRVAAKMGIPVCQHLRDYALLCPRSSMYNKDKNCLVPCISCRFLTFRARRASSTVKAVIAVSDFVQRRFLEHGVFNDAQWHVLHNTNTSIADFDSSILAARPIPESGFTFGYLGALSKEKGLEVLLRAFCILPEYLNARLLVAGRGKEDFVKQMMRILHNAGASDRVEWLGHVPAQNVFARSEAIIVPSLWNEPQSRVIVEAAVYGVPIIAAGTGGTREIVKGYRTGWVYNAEDYLALSKLMQEAAKDGAGSWRSSLPERFPGLKKFKGTSEETHFYERLEKILLSVK